MKLRNSAVLMLVLGLVLAVGVLAIADDRPEECKVVKIDKEAMVVTGQGEKEDRWALNWTETTKVKGDLTVEERKVGDKIHFEYMEKDGKMWLSELRRTDKAEG